MNLKLISAAKSTQKSLKVNESIFDCAYNETLLHEVITSYRINKRQGSVSQKTRSEVQGGGSKPWKQKGTGRARAGTIRSPLWRGGGVTFAASNREHSRKINKKVYRKAMKVALSELCRLNRLHVVDELVISKPKTKMLVEHLTKLNLDGRKIMIVVEEFDVALVLAARNLPNVNVLHVKQLNPLALVEHEQICFTLPAVKMLEEWLQ